MTKDSGAAAEALAVFGGGCFWCTEAVFRDLKGVHSVEPGYTGGAVESPTYEQVCSGNSGHIEVVSIRFDPAQVSFHDLLRVFFATHDPTTPDRQGNDIGPQYRSVVYWQTEPQREQAQSFIASLDQQQIYDQPIVTDVLPAEKVWPAETYHQDYFARNPEQGYCRFVVAPKVAKVRQDFSSLL